MRYHRRCLLGAALGLFVVWPVVLSAADLARGAEPDATLPYDASFVSRMAEEAAKFGSAENGVYLFTDHRFACISCHKVAEQGGSVGPDLSAIGKQRKPTELVESLFWPQRAVADEYVAWSATTTSGVAYQGYLQSSDDQRIRLFDAAAGVAHDIVRTDLDELVKKGSLMPTGLPATMSRQQQWDLLRFLMELQGADSIRPAFITALQTHTHVHTATAFPFDPGPLRPAEWPQRNERVNRDRVYDFYEKEAEYFRHRTTLPLLLQPFPGLDGGKYGHWGNQSEQDWADGRWNDTDLGWRQNGILRDQQQTIARGVCVRLGSNREAAACFNQDTLQFEALWHNGFVKFSTVRCGFLDGLLLDGERLPLEPTSADTGETEYHGFYRYGDRTVFAYRRAGREYLDSAWMEQGKWIRSVEVVQESPWRVALQGGPRQWPQVLETRIIPGGGSPYAVDTIELPQDNPWKALFYCSGHDFLADGTAFVCTMQGDVWRVQGLNQNPTQAGTARWTRFASGLHHPLGLVVVSDKPFVQCRDQLVCLHDINQDGEADFYECVNKAFHTSPAGHDFICGLEHDAAGNFYTASGNQGLLRLSADGKKAEVLATGFRNPDGLGLLPDGTITVPCSEGEWTPTSLICAVHPSDSTAIPHFGYPGPKLGARPELPLVYLPRGLDNSAGGQVYVPHDEWGPLRGQVIHLSFGTGTHFLLLRDESTMPWQAGIVPLPGDFLSGIHRGRFNPADGQLYVTGMDGWGTYTPADGCFQRVRYTGARVQLPVAFHAYQNGITVTFSSPIDRATAEAVQNHFAECWNYRYSEAYGSEEFSPSHYGIPGHDPIRIRSAHVLDDGRTLFLDLPDLQPVNQLHLHLQVDTAQNNVSPRHQELFLTLHTLDSPFRDIPGYVAEDKVLRPHPLDVDLAARVPPTPNPWREPLAGAVPIRILTGKNLTYATRSFQVSPGQPIALTLENPDVVPHNWVLIAPGTLQQVGEMANHFITNPQAVARHYVPESPLVLTYTNIIQPQSEGTIYFTAPKEPGRYPYLCTFPGHWMVMNGEMVVK